jgi:ankyrin repeat protein
MKLLVLAGILTFASAKIVNHKLDSILLESVNNEDIGGVRELFAGHIIPDINAKDIFGITSLTHAANWNYIDIVKMLIDAGANVDARDNNDLTARDYFSNKDEFDNIVAEYIAKIRSIIQEQDQLIPDLGNIITDYI